MPMYQDENDEFSSRFQPLVPCGKIHRDDIYQEQKRGGMFHCYVSLYKGVDALKKLFLCLNIFFEEISSNIMKMPQKWNVQV